LPENTVNIISTNYVPKLYIDVVMLNSYFRCFFLPIYLSLSIIYLGILAEWLLILQGVAEDRDMDMPKSCFKCRCHKAAKITTELSDLQRVVGDAEQAYERAGVLEVG
jgi:hypothetical protein